MESKKKFIRLYDDEGNIQVCPHISIVGKEKSSDASGAEYWEILTVTCFKCGDFEFTVMVN
jgi:hypothetical protein